MNKTFIAFILCAAVVLAAPADAGEGKKGKEPKNNDSKGKGKKGEKAEKGEKDMGREMDMDMEGGRGINNINVGQNFIINNGEMKMMGGMRGMDGDRDCDKKRGGKDDMMEMHMLKWA